MPLTFHLVPMNTRVESTANGQPVEITSSQTRTFLLTMTIADVIEQQSLDVSIWGSADGQNWGLKPLLKLPQRFYCGETRAVLDLTLRPEVKFIRPRWDLARWGRVAPTPMFVFGLHAAEVAAMKKAM